MGMEDFRSADSSAPKEAQAQAERAWQVTKKHKAKEQHVLYQDSIDELIMLLCCPGYLGDGQWGVVRNGKAMQTPRNRKDSK